MAVDGTHDPRFAPVREAYESLFAEGLDRGSALAVMAGDRLVVDLWGGEARAGEPWRRDTLVNVWSATKGVMATAMAMLVDRGQLAFDQPVADVWPEFGQNGKEGITVETVMSHRAGLNGLDREMDIAGLCAWRPYVEALERQAPLFPPGSLCVYHAVSYGHLTGEILRRVDGRTPGRFVAEEIAGPLGLSFYLGLPEEHDGRVAEMIDGPGAREWLVLLEDSDHGEAIHNPELYPTMVNDRAWRAAEIPGANGTGDAVALATHYAALARGGELGGVRLLSPETLTAATAERYRGPDASFGGPVVFAAGYALGGTDTSLALDPRAFGHNGWGGTLAFADPEAGFGFAYVTRDMRGFGNRPDARRERLTRALYDVLGQA